MYRIKLAAAPVSWGITEVAVDVARVSWPTVMQEIAQAGYAATELGPYGYYPTEPDVLRSALATHHLTLTSAFVPLPMHDSAALEHEVEAIMPIAQLLSDLDAEFIVLSCSIDEYRSALSGRVPDDGSAGLSETQWHAATARIENLARRCQDLGLRTVFHHHAGSYVETPAELAMLCHLTDPGLLGICLDTGHYVYGGGDPREALLAYGERIRYVHLKDIDAGRLAQARTEQWNFVEAVTRGVFKALGQGAANITGCVADLKAREYRGWVVVEQDMLGERDADGRTPLEGMTTAREYLRKLGLV